MAAEEWFNRKTITSLATLPIPQLRGIAAEPARTEADLSLSVKKIGSANRAVTAEDLLTRRIQYVVS
jgi:hypothetical protein